MYERIYLNLTNTNCKKENFLLYKDPVYKPTCVATKLALKLVSDDACLKLVPVNYSIRALHYNGNSF